MEYESEEGTWKTLDYEYRDSGSHGKNSGSSLDFIFTFFCLS
jgi:hypothetical protein